MIIYINASVTPPAGSAVVRPTGDLPLEGVASQERGAAHGRYQLRQEAHTRL